MTNQSHLPSDVRVLFSLKRRKRMIFKSKERNLVFWCNFFFSRASKINPPPHVRQGGGVNLQKICPFGDFSFFDPPLSFSQNLIYQNVDFKNIFIPGYRSSRIVNSYTRYFFAILWKSEIWNNIFLNFNSDGQFR